MAVVATAIGGLLVGAGGAAGAAAAGGVAAATGLTAAQAGTLFLTSVATSAIGGAVSAWGKGRMDQKLMEEEEAQKIAEEERRQAQYAGVGGATSFWDKEKAAPLQQSASVTPSLSAPKGPSTPKSSMKYNPATRQIERR